jgi:hypothetical protein
MLWIHSVLKSHTDIVTWSKRTEVRSGLVAGYKVLGCHIVCYMRISHGVFEY